MNFAQTLDKIMKERNISNYEMSKKTGISDSLIGYWRKGERVPKADNLLNVANFLECSVDYLLGRTEELKSNIQITGNTQNNINGSNNIATASVQSDTITDEFMKLFQSLDIADKIAIMNIVLKKSKQAKEDDKWDF